MRPLALLAALGAAALALAVGPPAQPSAELRQLVGQLGDDDPAVRKAAMTRLEARGEDVVPYLRHVGQSHADVDVRLRAAVVARAIHQKEWGLVMAFGPGAAAPTPAHPLNRVRFAPNGKYAVATASSVILYDLATGKEVRRAVEVGGARTSLAVSPDGKHALTGCVISREVHLLELPSLKTVWLVSRSFDGVQAVAFSADGELVAVSSGAESLELASARTGRRIRSLVGHRGSPAALAFSPDGKWLVAGVSKYGAGKEDELLVLYEVKTGRRVRAHRGHAGSVTGVAFRPGGKTFVSSSTDGTLRVWDVGSGQVLRSMTHGSHINDLAVSPDGTRALTAGFSDRCVKVWELESGRQLESFDGHMGAVLGVAFSPDGRRALSCDAVCCLRLWKLGR